MAESHRIILITGASSGLGAALAEHYAAAGITLLLTGRDAARLETTAQRCTAKGARVEVGAVDVTDAAAMQTWVMAQDKRTPIDLVIANAGVSGGMNADTRMIFATNLDGVLNTVLPIIPLMVTRKRGQIAIISSLAGMRGLPSAPAYSASKAAVKAWGEGLRGELAPHHVQVNVVCPGYIKTPLTDANTFPMPLLMAAPKAAKIIARRLSKNRSRIAFPFPLYFVTWLLACLSPALTDPLFQRLPKK